MMREGVNYFLKFSKRSKDYWADSLTCLTITNVILFSSFALFSPLWEMIVTHQGGGDWIKFFARTINLEVLSL